MALMGVFVSLVMPSFNQFIPNMKADKAASKLAADLRMAQQIAISDMSTVIFVIDASQNRYYAWIIDRDFNFDEMNDPLKGGAALFVDFDDDKTFQGVAIDSVFISSGSVANIWFNPLGSMTSPTGTVTITLRQPTTGYKRRIHVERPLGRVTVLQ